MSFGKAKSVKTKLMEKHKSGLIFEKRKSTFTGEDRVYVDMKSGLSENFPLTSIGVNKQELERFADFLKRVVVKLETMKNEG